MAVTLSARKRKNTVKILNRAVSTSTESWAYLKTNIPIFSLLLVLFLSGRFFTVLPCHPSLALPGAIHWLSAVYVAISPSPGLKDPAVQNWRLLRNSFTFTFRSLVFNTSLHSKDTWTLRANEHLAMHRLPIFFLNKLLELINMKQAIVPICFEEMEIFSSHGKSNSSPKASLAPTYCMTALDQPKFPHSL